MLHFDQEYPTYDIGNLWGGHKSGMLPSKHMENPFKLFIVGNFSCMLSTSFT